jgi:hypothetical protein
MTEKKRGRGRPPGTPNAGKGTGRKPIGATKRTSHTVTIAPDLLPLVQGHAKARNQSFSESVNMLLHEALRHHEIDLSNGEVY